MQTKTNTKTETGEKVRFEGAQLRLPEEFTMDRRMDAMGGLRRREEARRSARERPCGCGPRMWTELGSVWRRRREKEEVCLRSGLLCSGSFLASCDTRVAGCDHSRTLGLGSGG